MGRAPTLAPFGGAFGFAALVLAAGLWALKSRQDGKQTEKDERGGRRASITRNAPPVIDADVSDDEDDDLWEHIASMLEARRRSGGRSKKSMESDDEVWRIIAQIVAARGLSHRHFQSPDRTSTASVKELRRWFESQAAEKAALASSLHNEGGRNRQTRLEAEENGSKGNGVKENGKALESNGVGKGVLNEGEKEEPSENVQSLSFADDESSEEEDIEWEAIKASAVQLAKPSGKKLETGTSGKLETGASSRSPKQPAAGAKPLEVAPEPVTVTRPVTVTSAKESAGVVKEPVRRQKSPPAERKNDALERLNAEGGSVPVANGGGEERTAADSDRQNGASKDEKASRKDVNGSSVSGGSEYQGPPGGEDRVVIYLTSVRAVRKTFEQCATVRHIFHGFSVAVDERDISIHLPYRQELKDLMGGRAVNVPQVFIRGKHIGGLQEVQYLTDEKKMQELLVGMPRIKVTEECEGCGGGKFLPCAECRGSQKVLVGDKMEACTACNEYGLIRCPMCS